MGEIKNKNSSFESAFKKAEETIANKSYKKEEEVKKEIVSKPTTPPASKRKLKVHMVVGDHLILVDEKKNGYRIPLPKEKAEVGDTIYVDF